MKTNPQNPVVRIAPSPTGYMHIGTARTALFNFLFAKKYGGKFILRTEDTDTLRSKKEYEENIIEGLTWLGLTWDEFYRQSERTEIYKKYLKKIVDDGKAYISKEEVKKEGDREEVIRFKNSNTKIKFEDVVRGDIEFDTTELGDFVIAKSLNEPLYHFAVVVDDIEMGVTHVIRGEDHISNTPRQILICEALGATRPLYVHIPLILAPDRSRLSKRYGAVSLTQYREQGYLSEAMLNYLALLGWNPGGEQEIFPSLEALWQAFDLEKIQKSGAVFDIEKLNWINKEYIQKMSQEKKMEYLETAFSEYLPEIIKMGLLDKVSTIVLPRISYFSEIKELVESGELKSIVNLPEYEKEKLIWKKEDVVKTKNNLNYIIETLETAPDKTLETGDSIKGLLWNYAEENGRGNVLWPMRYALTGIEKSPDPFTIAWILGKNETLRRLKLAVKKLHE